MSGDPLQGLWRRITCRHDWRQHWSTPFPDGCYWECEKCGALS